MQTRLQTRINNKAKHISKCLELAILFEVGANKPGNVNLMVGFEGTRYEHFLASAVAAAPSFELAAKRGIQVRHGGLRVEDVRLGQIMRNCVADVNSWQRGGNTLLGTIILLSPIAMAAGMTANEVELTLEIPSLRRNLKFVVESTTAEDAVALYEAIGIAKPSGLNRAPELDVNDPTSVNKILKENIPLFEVFRIASAYDNVCAEWVNNYSVTFDFAYPCLMERIEENGDLNKAIIHAFLKVLAEYPDSFIARKVGMDKAKEVSSMAEEVLKLGGLDTPAGKEKLHEFDLELRKSGSLLNPGTTADMVAAALSLCVLGGYRP